MKLTNKRVLLTGASGGIGQALAFELASRGAHLILVGRNGPAMNELVKRLPGAAYHQVMTVKHYSHDEISELREVLQYEPRLDVLINNAGTQCFRWLEKQSFGDIHAQLYTNTEVPILLTRALLDRFNAEGMVVNVGSIMGDIGYPGYSLYCASKFALRGFSEALSRELADTGIRVVYVAPRATDTPLNSEAMAEMNRLLGNKSDSPQWVASQIITAIQKRRLRTRLGFPERFFVKINALLPTLVDNALIRKLAVIQQFARSSLKPGAKKS